MNERIKELAKQAGLEPTSGSWLCTLGIDVEISKAAANLGYSKELEKFAELILTDVFQHLTDSGHDYCREILEKRYDMVDPRFAEYLKEQYERTN